MVAKTDAPELVLDSSSSSGFCKWFLSLPQVCGPARPARVLWRCSCRSAAAGTAQQRGAASMQRTTDGASQPASQNAAGHTPSTPCLSAPTLGCGTWGQLLLAFCWLLLLLSRASAGRPDDPFL